MSRVAVIQMVSTPDVAENLNAVEHHIAQAVDQGAELVVLPECFAAMGLKPEEILMLKELLGSGPIQDRISKIAQKYSVWVVGGTLPIDAPHDLRAYACCIVWDANGKQVAHYNKLHLFDVSLPERNESYQESATYCPGDLPVVVDTPIGRLGLSVCYDLRFPELYRDLRSMGAEVVCVPSAFIQATGQVHWQPLLQARAIENQVYVIAANQGGLHANGRQTYGHSMIIGPWGLVLGQCETGAQLVSGEIDLIRLQVLREEFPCWDHTRLL